MTEGDVFLFAGSTGDMNPFHINEDFRHAVYIGDTVTAVAEGYNQDNVLVVEGKAVVMMDRMPTGPSL